MQMGPTGDAGVSTQRHHVTAIHNSAGRHAYFRKVRVGRHLSAAVENNEQVAVASHSIVCVEHQAGRDNMHFSADFCGDVYAPVNAKTCTSGANATTKATTRDGPSQRIRWRFNVELLDGFEPLGPHLCADRLGSASQQTEL
ncbi:MAG: hypothetical protein ACI9KE_002320 [Polyangiales bacterium]|jgi:hypothetical protein